MYRVPWTVKKVLYDSLGYKPVAGWQKAHQDDARFLFIAGGERGGKSYGTGHEVVPAIITGPWVSNQRSPKALFPFIGPRYEDAREEFLVVHDILKQLGLLQTASMPREGSWRLFTKLGAEVRTMTGEDAMKTMRSFTAEGMLLCEVGVMPKAIFDRAHGRLSSTQGFLIASGTFETALGWVTDLYNMGKGPNMLGLRSYSCPSWENEEVFPGGIQHPEMQRLRSIYTDEEWAIKVAAEPKPPAARIFKEFNGMIHVDSTLEMDKNEPVYVAVDPGWEFAYAVEAVQIVKGEVRVLDEVYLQQVNTADVINVIQHDRRWHEKIIGGAIDHAATQHHGNNTVKEEWDAAGIRLNSQYVHVDDLIRRIHTFLAVDPLTHRPRMRISPKCVGLIAELGGGPPPYPNLGVWEFRTDAQQVVLAPETPANKNDHACKALGYLLIDRFGTVGTTSRRLTGASARS
jgi:hypothetical protein